MLSNKLDQIRIMIFTYSFNIAICNGGFMADQIKNQPLSKEQQNKTYIVGGKTITVTNKTMSDKQSKEPETKKMENDRMSLESGFSESSISNSESEGLSSDHELDNIYNNKSKIQSTPSLDSGYQSDEENQRKSDLGNDEVAALSNIAQARIEDVKKLVGRLSTYVSLAKNKPEIDKRIIFNQSISSVIGDLAIENFRNSLSDQTTENLISAHIKNSENVKSFCNQEDKNKIDLTIAKIEAGLKGCELKNIENPIAREVANQVALELKGQKILKSDYANMLVSKTIERLQRDSNLSSQQLDIFKEDVNKANVNPKIAKELAKLSENDKINVSKAAEEDKKILKLTIA